MLERARENSFSNSVWESPLQKSYKIKGRHNTFNTDIMFVLPPLSTREVWPPKDSSFAACNISPAQL